MIRPLRFNVSVVVALSIIVIMLRGLQFTRYGSMWPLILAAVFAMMFLLSIACKSIGLVALARVWGTLLCVLGTARLFLLGAFILDPDLSTHGASITHPLYLTGTCALIVCGLIIVRGAKTITGPR